MKTEISAIDLLEQAVNLLRSAPLSAAATYLAGAIPFTLALLFYLSDMLRSPFASEHLWPASLGLAALYVWKNVWQGVFVEKLYRTLSPGQSAPGKFLRLATIQGTLQPVGLVLALPFPWLVAFFRNVALFAALGAPEPVKTARRQAVLWTRQNWGVLAMTTLAGLLLFANVMITMFLLPQLARSFLGIEGDFARAGIRLLNVPTLIVGLAVTWLLLDPLLDAVYVIRCFHGESIATGEDLRAALRRAVAIVVMAVALLGVAARPAMAQAPAIDPVKLDRSIDDVIHRREFTWRTPRPPGEEPKGRWVGWVRSAEDTIDRFVEWIKRIIRTWFEPKPQEDRGTPNSAVTPQMLKLLIGVAVALLLGVAVFLLRRKRTPVIEAKSVPVTASAVNLADESLTADQLPESSWLKLAEEWLAKGDFRLALRAMYLAGLNYLSERRLISIRRWKSGLDYQRELERRARENPRISPVFTRNVAIFERGWYGAHAVDRETVEAFAAGLSEMRSYAERAQS
jgi:hypothetical protein